jgi:catechol 2,3-dioxygenase-like lactoylglutathione lyase family enzyme
MASPVIDHVSIRVRDLAASHAFYNAVLAPLGFEEIDIDEDDGPGHAFGHDGCDDFAIHSPIDSPGRDRITTGLHLAFHARSRDAVDAFHRAALQLGAEEIGAPGIRDQYADGYYAAFVLDPDGNNVEAVFHEQGDPALED